MIIGKEFTFEAAHFLPGHEKCGRTHGHTYRLTVEVEGRVNQYEMVMDLHELSDIVREVIEQFDHSLLNDRFYTPTCEHMAAWIAMRIEASLPIFAEHPLRVHSVKLQEGEGGYAYYRIS